MEKDKIFYMEQQIPKLVAAPQGSGIQNLSDIDLNLITAIN